MQVKPKFVPFHRAPNEIRKGTRDIAGFAVYDLPDEQSWYEIRNGASIPVDCGGAIQLTPEQARRASTEGGTIS